MQRIAYIIVVVFVISLHISDSLAQDVPQNTRPEHIYSMGLPSRYEFSWGPMVVIDQQGEESKFGGQV